MPRSKLLLLALLLAAATPVAAQTSSDGNPFAGRTRARALGSGVLAPGDVLRVTVWRKPELSGDFTVAADSTLQHPLYRELKIVGLSLSDAEERLRLLLSRYEASPRLLLEPLLRVTVGGEVRTPGLYPLSPETTIAQAVALGGGPTADGRLDRVRLVREGRSMWIDLARTSAGTQDLTVRSGDEIYVGRKRHLWRDTVGPVSSLAAAVAAILTLMRSGQ